MNDLIREWHEREIDFYAPQFSSRKEAEDFYEFVRSHNSETDTPMQMLHQVYNFVTLAIDIEKIRPARDGLRLVFVKTCLEALAVLSGYKKPDFYKMFSSFFSDEGKDYILSNFKLISFSIEVSGHTVDTHADLTIDNVLDIIKIVRDKTVHDCDYWSFQMFAQDDDSTWFSQLDTDKKVQSLHNTNGTVQYHFSTTLQFNKFIYYFMEACIAFIKHYISTNCTH